MTTLKVEHGLSTWRLQRIKLTLQRYSQKMERHQHRLFRGLRTSKKPNLLQRMSRIMAHAHQNLKFL
jgi:hypothetical protein